MKGTCAICWERKANGADGLCSVCRDDVQRAKAAPRKGRLTDHRKQPAPASIARPKPEPAEVPMLCPACCGTTRGSVSGGRLRDGGQVYCGACGRGYVVRFERIGEED